MEDCCSCHESLVQRDHIELKPCGCIMCSKCLLKAHVERGTSSLFCPGCGFYVEAHEFKKGIATANATAVVASNMRSGRGYADAARNNHLKKQNNNNREAGLTLTLTHQHEHEANAGADDLEEDTSNNYDPDGTAPNDVTEKVKRPAPSGYYPSGRKKYARPLCGYEGCTNLVQSLGRCHSHGAKRYIKYCSVEGCNHQRRNHGVCQTHGAIVTKLRCNVQGCINHRILDGVCRRHGAKIKRKRNPPCSFEGCTNKSQKGGKCERHNGINKRKAPPLIPCIREGCNKLTRHGACYEHKSCCIEGCTKLIFRRGLCAEHGGGKPRVECSKEGCEFIAVKRGLCNAHLPGKEKKKQYKYTCTYEGCTKRAPRKNGGGTRAKRRHQRCEHDGCQKYAQGQGLCVEHGAVRKPKLCPVVGCTMKINQNGFCWTHGGRPSKYQKVCAEEGCDNQAQKRSYCLVHYNIDRPKKKYKWCARICKEDGCTKQVQVNGLCARHGGKRKKCSHEKCTSNVWRKGRCQRSEVCVRS